MWITLLVMAIAVSLEPFRLGMTMLMLNRPKPVRQLLAFLLGGFAMGMAVGSVVLFLLRPAVLGAGNFTLPKVQILIGCVALFLAAVIGSGILPKRSDDTPGRIATWGSRLANGSSLWVAGTAGLGIALPSVDYLAALAVILASNSTVSTQLTALVLFNVVAFALVEIPLVASLVAPQRTLVTLDRLNRWLRARRRRDVALLLAAVGLVLVLAGLIGI